MSIDLKIEDVNRLVDALNHVIAQIHHSQPVQVTLSLENVVLTVEGKNPARYPWDHGPDYSDRPHKVWIVSISQESVVD